MAKIVTGIFMAIITAFIFGANADTIDPKFAVSVITWDQFVSIFCQNLPSGAYSSICQQTTTTTTTTSTSTAASTSSAGSSSSSAAVTSSTASSSSNSPSRLENAHWCKFYNGSYIARGLGFLHNDCYVCRCTESHQVVCTRPSCMAAYCIDNSKSVNRSGQCCPQCAYEPEPKQCIVNGLPFPHGTLLKQTSDYVFCWCQLGNVECRKVAATLLSSLDYWGKGSAVYIIVIIICIFVILGSLLCLGSALFFYYYYKRSQQATQQAYEQYYSSAGWQPMTEDGQVADTNAEAKKAEAEQSQYGYEYATENSEQYIPPPYAIYNGTYDNAQAQKS